MISPGGDRRSEGPGFFSFFNKKTYTVFCLSFFFLIKKIGIWHDVSAYEMVNEVAIWMHMVLHICGG